MSNIHSEYSEVIDARPEEIYAVLVDYRHAHNQILPRPAFSDLTIEEGGQGAGTVFRLVVTVLGQANHYHMKVSEPEPGRVLRETDLHNGQYSTFTLEPLNGGRQTRLTIESDRPASPGLKGQLEKLFEPRLARGMFRQEMDNLKQYLREHSSTLAPA